MKPQIVKTPLECDKDGTWYYVHISKQIRDQYKRLESRGSIPIVARVGSSIWHAGMLPWADGSAQISINKKVRTQEAIRLGDEVTIIIEPREV